jgi:uncharacterized glyoxalase superfamily protein PhnB
MSRDIDSLSTFYATTFGFEMMPDLETPIFRAVDATHGMILGFHAAEAWELMEIESFRPEHGTRQFLSFEFDSDAEVDGKVRDACRNGATVVKAPYDTYYNARQAILTDPEGNLFRINHDRP